MVDLNNHVKGSSGGGGNDPAKILTIQESKTLEGDKHHNNITLLNSGGGSLTINLETSNLKSG